MSLSNNASLAIAELIIYILLLPIIIYVLIKHGKKGLMGYIYLVTFDILRIVPAAMQINDYVQSQPESTTTAVIDSIGLSPLILATAGVIHEIQSYLRQSGEIQARFERQLQTLLHISTIVGVALSAYAASKLAESDLTYDQISQYQGYQEGGSILLLLAWIFLVLSTARLAGVVRYTAERSTFWQFITVVGALVPIMIRAIYGVVYAFDHSQNISPITGSFAIRLVLVFLMLLLGAIFLVAGGVVSRHVREEYAEKMAKVQGFETAQRGSGA